MEKPLAQQIDELKKAIAAQDSIPALMGKREKIATVLDSTAAFIQAGYLFDDAKSDTTIPSAGENCVFS
jgi:hypothetical protein